MLIIKTLPLYICIAVLLLTANPALAQQQMSAAENRYYAQVFDYVMLGIKKDDIYKWETYQSNGAIRPGDYFISQSKALCRPFVEVVTIDGQTYSGRGYGCQRQGREGWCRLKEGNMMSCALEPSDNMLNSMLAGASRMTNGAGMPSLGPVDASGMPVISDGEIGKAINSIGSAVSNPSSPSMPNAGAAISHNVNNAQHTASEAIPEKKEVRGKTVGVVNWIGGLWPF